MKTPDERIDEDITNYLRESDERKQQIIEILEEIDDVIDSISDAQKKIGDRNFIKILNEKFCMTYKDFKQLAGETDVESGYELKILKKINLYLQEYIFFGE